MPKLNKHGLTAALVVVAAMWTGAQSAPLSEYEVKAAFIHNIAKFVEWPGNAPAAGKLRLCILGADPFGSAVNVLQGKQIGSLTWEVLSAGLKNDLKECRVLFISPSESGNLRGVLDGLKGSAVLTVGDTDGYAEQGVIVNFYQEDNKVRFEINLDAAKRAGLTISSQLLKLSKIVRGSGE